jgi:CheY-like chemotaxis protein
MRRSTVGIILVLALGCLVVPRAAEAQQPVKIYRSIIAVTSYALSGDDAQALVAGCDGYVAKPFSTRVLLAKVREYLPEEPRPGGTPGRIRQSTES